MTPARRLGARGRSFGESGGIEPAIHAVSPKLQIECDEVTA